MILEILDANHLTTDELKNAILKIRPKRLFVFFDKSNFLLTNHFIENSINPFMLIEDQQGNELYINNCNCGYAGHGPNNTKKILIGLGADKDFVDKIILYNGIIADFDDSGKLMEETFQIGALFESRASHVKAENIFYKNMLCNYDRKQLYILNCRGKNFIGLLKCIDQINIETFEYYVGTNSNTIRDLDLPYSYESLQNCQSESLSGPYIWINAKPFSIFCLLGFEAPFSYIDAVYNAITGMSLFDESDRWFDEMEMEDVPVFYIKLRRMIQTLLFAFKKKELYARIPIKGGLKYE